MPWNPRRRCAPLLPLLAALALGAGPGCVQHPVVTIHHAEVRGMSAYGLGVTIFLQIQNDNAYDVQLRNVHCNVTFGRGNTLGPIDFQPNTWLPANQTTLVPVPVNVPWQLLPALAAETSGSYAIPYHVNGMADVTATRTFGIDRNNYPIDEGGSVPRQMVIDAARSMSPIPLPF
jgi:hypothetical protein